jgi:Domain of unknown function (DUF4288)
MALDSHTGPGMNAAPSLRWYVAILVVAACVDEAWEDERIIDYQVRLVQAPDPDVAFTRANELGAAAEHSYLNADGMRVHWEFCGLADLTELAAEERNDGGEVYSWRTRGDPLPRLCQRNALPYSGSPPTAIVAPMSCSTDSGIYGGDRGCLTSAEAGKGALDCLPLRGKLLDDSVAA